MGRKRVAEHLKPPPYPHYEPSDTPGLLVRITADGKRSTGRFANADVLANELEMEPYAAARVAASLRGALVEQRESFVFETVFSDPVGDKLAFLKDSVARGYSVILCFIGISGPEVSEQRVAMRVSQGGHDVPSDKLITRYPRTLANAHTPPRIAGIQWVGSTSPGWGE